MDTPKDIAQLEKELIEQAELKYGSSRRYNVFYELQNGSVVTFRRVNAFKHKELVDGYRYFLEGTGHNVLKMDHCNESVSLVAEKDRPKDGYITIRNLSHVVRFYTEPIN